MIKGEKISNKEYRKREGISSTELKRIAKSPAYFKYCKENPQEEDTPALLFGRASHKFALEQDDFFNEFAVMPLCDRRTKEGKQEYAIFCKENEGKDIISLSDFDVIKDMRKALYETPFVEKLLSGEKETSYFTKDDKTGIVIKCRPDCLTEIGDTLVLIDYKTTDNADTDSFMKQAIKLNYDLQMAYYADIVEKCTGKKCNVVFIAQEKKAPYLVNVMQANDYFLRSGRDMYQTQLKTYSECLKTDNWYGYMKGEINSLGLPTWLQKLYETEG